MTRTKSGEDEDGREHQKTMSSVLSSSGGGCMEAALAAQEQRAKEKISKRGFMKTAAATSVTVAGLSLPVGADNGKTDEALIQNAENDDRVEIIQEDIEASGWERDHSNTEVHRGGVDVGVTMAYSGDGGYAFIRWSSNSSPIGYEIDTEDKDLTYHGFDDGGKVVGTATEEELEELNEESDDQGETNAIIGFIMSLSPVGSARACSVDPTNMGGYDCCGSVSHSCIANKAVSAGIACYACRHAPSHVTCAPCAVELLRSGYMSTQECCSGYWY